MHYAVECSAEWVEAANHSEIYTFPIEQEATHLWRILRSDIWAEAAAFQAMSSVHLERKCKKSSWLHITMSPNEAGLEETKAEVELLWGFHPQPVSQNKKRICWVNGSAVNWQSDYQGWCRCSRIKIAFYTDKQKKTLHKQELRFISDPVKFKSFDSNELNVQEVSVLVWRSISSSLVSEWEEHLKLLHQWLMYHSDTSADF